MTSYEKLHGIWLQKWNQIPKYKREDLDQTVHTMRKLLIYYPKNVKLLKSKISHFSLEAGLEVESEAGKCFAQIFSRYKGEFFRQNNADLSSSRVPLWRIYKTTNLLKLFQSGHDANSKFTQSLRKVLTTNTNLQTLELSKGLNCLEKVLSCMKYVRTLKFLHLSAIPCLPLDKYKRALLASSQALENVSLTGILVQEFIEWTDVEVVGLIKMILELPKLKRLNFDVQIPENLDINQIPFSILKKKGIAYNIRLLESKENLFLSGATESGLEPLEFLGINGTGYWHDNKPTWNAFQEEHLKAQEKAHSVLFISIFKMPRADISHLLTTCKNIITLDISLSIKSYIKGVSFAELKHLPNLQNLFLTIDNVATFIDYDWPSSKPRCCSSDLFENLVFCAKTLRSVNIHLCGRTVYSNDKHIFNFFEACSKTLTRLTLIHSYHENTPMKRMNVFYKGIALLNNLQSLNLLYYELDYTYTRKIPDFKKIIQNQNLKELHLSTATVPNAQINLSILPNLEKLGLEICNGALVTEFSNFLCLKDLEIYVSEFEISCWHKLLGTFRKLKLLETLKLKCSFYLSGEKDKEKIVKIALMDLDMVKKNHPSLRFIAFCEKSQSEKVWLFGRSTENGKNSVDSFMGRNENGIPRRRVYNVYSV